MAKIEFYIGSSSKSIVSLTDSAVPREGEFVNIKKITYEVLHVTWAIDHCDKLTEKLLRANVELKKAYV